MAIKYRKSGVTYDLAESSDITNVNTSITNLSTTEASDIKALKSSVSTNASNISSVKTTVTSHTESIASLDRSVEANADDIATNITNIDTNKTNITTNTKNITTLQTSVDDHEDRITALEEASGSSGSSSSVIYPLKYADFSVKYQKSKVAEFDIVEAGTYKATLLVDDYLSMSLSSSTGYFDVYFDSAYAARILYNNLTSILTDGEDVSLGTLKYAANSTHKLYITNGDTKGTTGNTLTVCNFTIKLTKQ